MTNAQRIEVFPFRLGAVFQRGRPMNRSFAHAGAVRTQAARPGGRQETRHSPLNRLWRAAEAEADATAKRRKTSARKARWKEKTAIHTWG